MELYLVEICNKIIKIWPLWDEIHRNKFRHYVNFSTPRVNSFGRDEVKKESGLANFQKREENKFVYKIKELKPLQS